MGGKRVALILSLCILASAFIIFGVYLLTAPKQPALVDVLDIGTKYVEKTYGTDYAINGGVVDVTYSNGTGTWTYPAASFRVPEDWQKSGIIVEVMVDPGTGHIFKVLTEFSKIMPIPTP